MDLDRFLSKYVLDLDRAQARRDLAAVIEDLDESTVYEIAHREGYRTALEDARSALAHAVTGERFGWWLRDQLAAARKRRG